MYLTFISIDDHGHSLHVHAILNDAFQTSRQLFVECVKTLGRNRTNVDWQVDLFCADVF